MLLYHLTRDLTNAPTTLCLLCDVATLGSVASYVATYVLLRVETLFRPYGSLPLSSTLWGGIRGGFWGGWEGYPLGEVYGEVCGEVLDKHLTIQIPL